MLDGVIALVAVSSVGAGPSGGRESAEPKRVKLSDSYRRNAIESRLGEGTSTTESSPSRFALEAELPIRETGRLDIGNDVFERTVGSDRGYRPGGRSTSLQVGFSER